MSSDFRLAAALTALAIATPAIAWAAPPESEVVAESSPETVEPEPVSEPEPEPEPEPASEPEPEPESSAPKQIPDDQLETAEARYDRAVEHFNLAKYELAVPLFESVYREIQSPDLLFNLGQCHWKWFNTDADVEHLHQARIMFQNYDKAMRGSEGYNYREIDAYLAAIDAQIGGIEASAKVELKPLESTGVDRKMLEYERQRRINSGLTITGVTFGVLGGAALVAGGISLAVRAGNEFALEQAGAGEPGSPNPFSAEEYEQLRTSYLRSGQVAFGSLIAGAVLFPVGLTLALIGSQRNKRLVEDPRFVIVPSASGLVLRF